MAATATTLMSLPARRLCLESPHHTGFKTFRFASDCSNSVNCRRSRSCQAAIKPSSSTQPKTSRLPLPTFRNVSIQPTLASQATRSISTSASLNGFGTREVQIEESTTPSFPPPQFAKFFSTESADFEAEDPYAEHMMPIPQLEAEQAEQVCRYLEKAATCGAVLKSLNTELGHQKWWEESAFVENAEGEGLEDTMLTGEIPVVMKMRTRR